MTEAQEFEIDRIWDINGCRPPCCPHTLLFRTTAGPFVFVETWQKIEEQDNDAHQSRLIIESTPAGKNMFKFARRRGETIAHTEKLRELNEFFEISGQAEWLMYKKEELPADVMAILESV